MNPIERDEEMDRTYIPLPGGWEIQTKGRGSTFRICAPDGERLAVPDAPYLHETLERMARDIHAAADAEPLIHARREAASRGALLGAMVPKPCKGHKTIRDKRKKLRKARKAGQKAARKNDA